MGILLLWAIIHSAAGAEPIPVFVSILPQKYFVERVGGDHVKVEAMVTPGQSPATYEPTPKQMTRLAAATAYFRIGVPFENVWIERIRAANPALKIIDARDGIPLRSMEADEAGAEHGHAHGRHDPHIWTAPPLVKIMAARIRDVLTRLDPAHGDDYATNYASFAADLDALDQEIRQTLEPRETRGFLVYHPTWGYFADTYGLQQIPIESEGKEPGAKQLATLIDKAKEMNIRVIFVQRQFSRRNAETVAKAIDGKVVSVDPLAEDYLENTRFIASAFADALR